MAVSLHAAKLLFVLWLASKTQGMICWMGQEPDPSEPHRYRWVIPVEDPCKCTEIRPGGMTSRTPNRRHFNVIYLDTFLTSNSPMEIRKLLHCPATRDGIRENALKARSAHTSTALATGPLTNDALTTDATTTAIPFTCDGKSDGRYPDVTDCGKYYICSNTKMFHSSCAAGTYFNSGGCGFTLSGLCNV